MSKQTVVQNNPELFLYKQEKQQKKERGVTVIHDSVKAFLLTDLLFPPLEQMGVLPSAAVHTSTK